MVVVGLRAQDSDSVREVKGSGEVSGGGGASGEGQREAKERG